MDTSTNAACAESQGRRDTAFVQNGSGTPLFLINLCASMAPVPLPQKTLPGLERYRLYQVSRMEDGRTRYRVRLGFFASEAEAEAVVEQVRAQYPTAFTACLCEEDHRHTRGFVMPAAPMMQVVASTPAAVPSAANSISTPRASSTPATAARVAPPPAGPQRTNGAATPDSTPSVSEIFAIDDLSWDAPAPQVITKKTSAPRQGAANAPITPPQAKAQPSSAERAPAKALRDEFELTFCDPPAASAAPKQQHSANEPFHVGKGIEIPTTELTLQSEASDSAPTRNQQASPRATQPPAPSASAATVATAPAKRPVPTPRSALGAPPPDLDSTQTIRALTNAELEDDTQEKWFAIQLAVSDQPVNLDAMPHLDIFEAYSVYSVATAGSGKITHSLRLGFFKEAVSAEAVSGYLKTFFGAPTVLRISVAEQARFKDATMKQRPASLAAPNVIELNDARASRVPTVTLEVAPPPKTPPKTPLNTPLKTPPVAKAPTRTTEHAKANAAKSAAPAQKRSDPLPTKKPVITGKYAIKKSLSEQLRDEARQVALSESGVHRAAKSESLLSRLVEKLKK